ncbi:MAG: hypothetical protein JXB05_14920 [Myxococcaceae bacterium]|nr:hypothetical protein [Myxococcaceae bacterium]
MPPLGFPSDIQKELEASTSLVEALRAHWPEAIDLRTDRLSSYFELPYLFLPAFPHLPLHQVRPLAAFTRLMSGALQQHDTLAAGERTPLRAGEDALRLMAMQFEACQALYASIPAGAPFWARLRTYLSEYAHACVEERAFGQAGRSWREYTQEVARRIILGKHGVARAVVAGLVELARDERLFAPLLEALDAFNFASQLCDNLLDWRDDAFQSTPSLLLARVLPERPTLQGTALEHELDRLGRELYHGGHASHVVGLALSALDAADKLHELLPGVSLPWYLLTDSLRRRCLAVREHIQRITAEQLPRVREAPRLELELPEPEERWQRVAWGALRFLVRQWHLGFGEMRAAGHASKQKGAASAILPRALVIEALCDADALLGGRMKGLLDYEVRVLLGRRGLEPATGGSPRPGHSPDADTLAHVARALVRAGHGAEAEQSFGAPLEELLATSTGSAAERATLLHTLWLLTPERHAAQLQRCAEQLEGLLEPVDFWKDLSHFGPYSRAHSSLRLLASARPESPALRRLVEFLHASQRGDGGWGAGAGPSDALSTALALLTLSAARGTGTHLVDAGLAARALGFLEAARGAEGAWPAQPVPKPYLDTPAVSRTLTSALVLQAALSCQRWGEEPLAPRPPKEGSRKERTL